MFIVHRETGTSGDLKVSHLDLLWVQRGRVCLLQSHRTPRTSCHIIMKPEMHYRANDFVSSMYRAALNGSLLPQLAFVSHVADQANSSRDEL